MAKRRGKRGNSGRFCFLGLHSHCRWWLQLWNWKSLAAWKKSYDKPWQHIKKQRCNFADKGLCIIKAMVFPVVMYGCKNWTRKKAECWRIWYFLIVVLEKTLECPLDSKESKPVDPKGNQPWIFTGRTDAWCWSWNSNTLATWWEKLSH